MGQLPWVPPSNILFDLASGNLRSLKDRRRLKFLPRLPGDNYIFDFQGESTVAWKICVHDIAVALSIIRQNDNLSDYNLAHALLNQGSPFRTVLRTARFSVASPAYGIPRLRLSTFHFGPEDYQSYCHQRADILRNPRIARQALMRGGIIWRLTMDNASFQDVLAGPTAVATAKHQCTSWVSESGTFYVDDILASHEADVILGVYNVYTGKL